MPEVYIDSLTIENFGPYYGEQEFQFGNLDGNTGILIGGKNGVGKTHLLRALYLAVVGETGVHDLKKSEPGSDFVFEKCLSRKAEAEGKDTTRFTITISQRDERGTGSRKVKLVREIRHRRNSPPAWYSYAEKSGTGVPIEDEMQIHKLRDAFLPRHLARFFFFDAERSQNFSLGQKDIVDGVSRILGYQTYGDLETDLRSLIQNKIPRIYSSSAVHEAANKLADLNADVVRSEGHLKASRAEESKIQLELSEIAAELLEVEDELKTLGAVDPAELTRSQERRLEITKIKADLEAQLGGAWEQAMPVALLGTYRKELNEYLVREEKRRDWDSRKSSVEPKIPQIKEDVFEYVAPEFALAPDSYSYYSDRLEKALHRLFHPAPEGMSDNVFVTDRNDLSAQIRSRLTTSPVSIRDLAETCVNLEKLDAELRETESKLKAFSQNTAAIDRGRELHEKRGELTSQQAERRKRQTELTAEIANLESAIAESKREETNQTEIVDKAEEGQSLAAMAARYREAATEIRARAAVELRERLSEHVGDLWTQITDRRREFVGMEFDNHWQCSLIRRNGKKVLWDDTNTSAGQRQVRMLAFYEALRRLARLVPPLVVDTPLGRLDKEVREAVLDKLYLSGHQSLILSTNSEIDPDGPLFAKIKNRLARVYTLHPHGKEDSEDYEVRVTSDYFGRNL